MVFLFPSAEDANRTNQYLRDVRKVWPGFYFETETENGTDMSGPPTLQALHIVFGWSKELMKLLHKNQRLLTSMV